MVFTSLIQGLKIIFLFQTVFELNPQQKSVQYEIMKNKRAAHGEIIKMFQKKVAEIEQETENNFLDNVSIKCIKFIMHERFFKPN